LNSRYSFFSYLLTLRSLARGLPTSERMKFFARDSISRLVADLMMGIAPSDFRSFSATFRALRVSF